MPEGTIVTTPQLITQRDEGNTPADPPSVDVQIVTSVVTSTTVQPSGPSLNQGPNQGPNSQGSDNNGPGSGPGQGQGPPKSGLQPPPAVMQWVQSMLVNIEVAWMIFYPAVESVRSWIGRKTPDKLTSDDEKPDGASQADSASQDSEDSDAQSGESTAAASTTTVNQAANSSQSGDESVLVKDILHSLGKLMQSGCKPPSGSPNC